MEWNGRFESPGVGFWLDHIRCLKILPGSHCSFGPWRHRLATDGGCQRGWCGARFWGERWGSDGEMSSVQNLGWLFYVENYTTHFYGDCNKHRDPMLSIRIQWNVSQTFWTLLKWVPKDEFSKGMSFSFKDTNLDIFDMHWSWSGFPPEFRCFFFWGVVTSSFFSYGWMFLETPWKIDVGTWTSPVWKDFEKGNHLPNLHLWLPAANFQGFLKKKRTQTNKWPLPKKGRRGSLPFNCLKRFSPGNFLRSKKRRFWGDLSHPAPLDALVLCLASGSAGSRAVGWPGMSIIPR